MVITKDFVFVHIPRTAGTSLSNYFKYNYEIDTSYDEWFNHMVFMNNKNYNLQNGKKFHVIFSLGQSALQRIFLL